MTAKKKSFVLHIDSLEIIEELDMEQRGKLLTAIFDYQSGNELPKMDQLMKIVFLPFKNQFDRDNEKYHKTCETNRNNISKKYKKSEQPKPTPTDGIIPEEIVNKLQETVPVVNDKESVNENETKKKTVPKKETVKKETFDFTFTTDEADTKKITENKFLEIFNRIKKEYFPKSVGHSKLTKTDKNNFEKLMANNYNEQQITDALRIMFTTKWVLDTGNDVPTHFVIENNFNRYFSRSEKEKTEFEDKSNQSLKLKA